MCVVWACSGYDFSGRVEPAWARGCPRVGATIPHVRGSVMDPTPPAGAHAAAAVAQNAPKIQVGGAMHTLSLNTTIRPVLSLGALVRRHEAVPCRRIWVKDAHGVFIFSNTLFQVDAGGDPVGRCDADLPWADRALEYAVADAEAASGAAVIVRERVRAACGADREVITHKSALLGADGRLIGTLGLYDPVEPGRLAVRAAERRCRECASALEEAIRARLTRAE